MPQLHFLEAKIPLSKTFVKKGDNKYEQQPYPLAKNLTSHTEEVNSLIEFARAIRYHSVNGHVLLKGKLVRKLELESRSGHTDTMAPTDWVCLDLDFGIKRSQVDFLLAELGIEHTNYIMQYSAGYKITKPFAAHLFLLLDKPVSPEQLKLWLMHKNLTVPVLSSKISLQRTNVALRWPLDVVVADNSRLLYIAPPTCKNFNSPIDPERRIGIVRRDAYGDVAQLSEKISELDASVVDELHRQKLNELREAKGLPKKKLNVQVISGLEIGKNPGKVSVTSVKQERNWVYLNLNGGDSWGYYHPKDNAEILFNFKGEPNYYTKELVPGYYKAWKNATKKPNEDGIRYFAFLDRRTDRYYRGGFDEGKQNLELWPTSSVRKVEDFLKQTGQPVGEYIEEWDYLFRFEDSRVYDKEERFVNRFSPTPYLKEGLGSHTPTLPPVIGKILYSVVGSDKAAMLHFLNWLAVIIQKRRMTQTMWVFNGVPGTGKGLMVHKILTPILGAELVQVKSMAELEEQFNAYMETCVLLMVDETQVSQVKNQDKVMARIKQASTDPVISIRRMQVDHYMAKNYLNIIFTSNHPEPVVIEPSDRRFNVGVYQTNKLQITDEEVAAIKDELWPFVTLLRTMKADVVRARTPLDNESRRRLMYLSQNSVEVVFAAVVSGNLQFFIDNLPTDRSLVSDPMATVYLDQFIAVLREAEKNASEETKMIITRDQLRMLCEYTLGDMPKTANKFTAMAKHHGVEFHRTRKNGASVPAITVMWRHADVSINDMLQEQPRQLKAVN